MPLTREDVLGVARLARLDLAADEADAFVSDLARILAHVERTFDADLDGISETTHAAVDRLPLRPDEPAPSLGGDAVHRNAPRANDAGFGVPGYVKER